ncbi:SDR family oxidoreductase [Rhodococcus sp. P1Y]|nr:SDR family oxidoreductase [Rhodococcus sp. P1Y]
MDMNLSGRSAFVSGSTEGIGYEIARSLAVEGVDVTVNGRDAAKLDHAVASLQREAPAVSVDGVAADFGVAADVERLCSEIVDVDILVCNVGLFELKAFQDISDADWQRYFDVNVMSGVRLARRLMPGMLRRNWGRIVFVNSESAVDVPADMIHYGATKAALLSLGNGLAKLTEGTAVTVNSVLGGPTYSAGVARTVEMIAEQQSIPVDDMKAAIVSANSASLLQRFIEPAEIANMVAFLASPAASATNGTAVRVDGGIGASRPVRA